SASTPNAVLRSIHGELLPSLRGKMRYLKLPSLGLGQDVGCGPTLMHRIPDGSPPPLAVSAYGRTSPTERMAAVAVAPVAPWLTPIAPARPNRTILVGVVTLRTVASLVIEIWPSAVLPVVPSQALGS